MAADRRLRVAAATLAAACVPVLASPVAGDAPAPLAKPSAATKAPAPTERWFDGGTSRPLTRVPGLRADFTPRVGATGAVLREASGPLKDVPGVLQSPVLRDETGRLRALPGGVLVVLGAPLDDAAARALLARHGAVVRQRVSPRTWLVESPAGLESLALANRLAQTGEFAAAQPNWWVERVRK